MSKLYARTMFKTKITKAGFGLLNSVRVVVGKRRPFRRHCGRAMVSMRLEQLENLCDSHPTWELLDAFLMCTCPDCSAIYSARSYRRITPLGPEPGFLQGLSRV